MELAVVGLNYKSAPISVREKVSFTETENKRYYNLLRELPHIAGIFILSTCNRVELYGTGFCKDEVLLTLERFLYNVHGLPEGILSEHIYRKSSIEALGHLFRVTSGLDSMIMGETQITGQVKRAYINANNAGFINPYLHGVLQDALRINKKVRTLTKISCGVTSMPGAAFELVKNDRIVPVKRVLVIGSGKIGKMTIKKLMDLELERIVIVNRNRRKAEDICTETNVNTADYTNLEEELHRSNVVITATSSRKHILTYIMIRDSIRTYKRNLLLVDMGLPRNIEESAGSIEGITLYNIDNLGAMIHKTKLDRVAESVKAENIVTHELCVKSFLV